MNKSQSVIWNEYPLIETSVPTIKSHGPNFSFPLLIFLYCFLYKNFPYEIPEFLTGGS